MAMIRVRARVATTHEVAAYGGFRLAESALHQMAEAISTGKAKMNYSHDVARPVSPENVRSGVEQLEDGEFATWVEFDVDGDAWNQFEEERSRVGAPGGFSFSATSPFAFRGEPPYDFFIAADVSHFPVQSVISVIGETLPKHLSVDIAELFQFSWIPEPRVIIEIGMALLASSPSDLVGLLLSELASRLKAQLAASSAAPASPTFELKVRRTPESESIDFKVSCLTDEGLTRAMLSAPEVLRASRQSAYWDEQVGRWREIAQQSLIDSSEARLDSERLTDDESAGR